MFIVSEHQGRHRVKSVDWRYVVTGHAVKVIIVFSAITVLYEVSFNFRTSRVVLAQKLGVWVLD